MPTSAEYRFTAMGSEVHLLVTTQPSGPAPADLAAHARRLLEDWEARWSRFRADSELCQLNRCAGRGPVSVSALTVDLVGAAVEGWRLTGGRFDPTVLTALVAHGYDTTFADLPPADPPGEGPATPARDAWASCVTPRPAPSPCPWAPAWTWGASARATPPTCSWSG